MNVALERSSFALATSVWMIVNVTFYDKGKSAKTGEHKTQKLHESCTKVAQPTRQTQGQSTT
ncbi:hypothetical protein HMPREF9244_01232 [Alloscardovia omnicolens F0580]|uniref:Uncharacterized protein n=1 Tax=Alloscardovia omnicolens F0580 TaxID=1321816 RepID=U1R820_9BIFI|nr:hypothetical protein HMPREF9244_01232 [Alloscardovia omnicolens F0580]